MQRLTRDERGIYADAINDALSCNSTARPSKHLKTVPDGLREASAHLLKRVKFSDEEPPESLGKPLCHQNTLSTTSPTRETRHRLALFCAGVCSERILQKLSWWNFEVVLIVEIDDSLSLFAKSHFPRATMVSDIRAITELVNSGQLRLKADVGMATFPCQSQSALKDLNGYADLHTADLFRGHLRFKIMDLLKIKF